jgi:uncharacterized protein YjbI with pentapeptide repeats
MRPRTPLPVLVAALTALPAAAEDLGFRLDEATCTCRNARGEVGFNPDYLGECGRMGDDPALPFDARPSLFAADLNGKDLHGMNLRGAQLRGVRLERANLSGADLTCADLTWARVRGASFRSANLVAASFRCAWLFEVDFREADLRGTVIDDLLPSLRVETCLFGDNRVDEHTRLASRVEALVAVAAR